MNLDLGLIDLRDTRQEATLLRTLGYRMIPLCWPTYEGSCACGRCHTGRNVGKAPLTYWRDRTDVSEAQIDRWWRDTPDANIGILIHLSKLLVIDVDGDAGMAEVAKLGVPDTVSVKANKGAHYYFRRPDNLLHRRRTQRGESKQIDVLTLGYVVAPPSRHRSGHIYQWNAPPVAPEDLPDPPAWAIEILQDGVPERPAWAQPRMQRRRRQDGSFRVYTDPNDTKEEYLRAALSYLDADQYETWIHIGMALHTWDTSGNGMGKGFALWDAWSRGSAKYAGQKELRAKWRSFRRTGINVATVYALAANHGYSTDSRCHTHVVKRKGNWKTS